VAGLIRREDIEAVRERARLEDVVGEHVTLKSAGVGSLKGLCPFHDERTPSFHVRPQLGYWHCFGCGEGGDVITFIEKIHHLGFAEAVEYLSTMSSHRVSATTPPIRAGAGAARAALDEFATTELGKRNPNTVRVFEDAWSRFQPVTSTTWSRIWVLPFFGASA